MATLCKAQNSIGNISGSTSIISWIFFLLCVEWYFFAFRSWMESFLFVWILQYLQFCLELWENPIRELEVIFLQFSYSHIFTLNASQVRKYGMVFPPHPKFIRHYILPRFSIQSFHPFSTQNLSYIHVVVLEWAHISSNSSFIEHENFKFEHLSSSWKMNLLSLSLNLEMSLLSLSISSFIKFKFLKITNHRTRILSSLKFE